jgi:hypothetical protein
MNRRIAATVSLLVVSACGGGEGESETGPSTPASIAEAVGCELQPDKSEEIFVKEAGTCKLGGQEVTIKTFGNSDGLDGWTEMAETFGGTFLVGNNWVMEGPRPALETAMDKVGGEIR